MTNDELNARAAEIMGWEEVGLACGQSAEKIPCYCGEKFEIRKEFWNPAENIAQAFEVAGEMCEDYELKYDGDIYDFTIAGVLRRGDALAETITRACVAVAEKATPKP